MKRKLYLAVATAAVLLGSGCSSSKLKTSDANFMAGLNAYYSTHNDCLFPSALRFPYEVSPSATAKDEKKHMDALTAAGLMKKTEDRSINVNVYSLTTAGERAGGRFCYGHRQITAIDSFTPPVKNNGMLDTDVTYRYLLMDVPVWAKADEVKAAFPEMAQAIASGGEGKSKMANAGAGWQVPN